MTVFISQQSSAHQGRAGDETSNSSNRWTSCLVEPVVSNWVTLGHTTPHHTTPQRTVTLPPCLHLNFTTIRTGLAWTWALLAWLGNEFSENQPTLLCQYGLLTTLHSRHFYISWNLRDKVTKKTENIWGKFRELFAVFSDVVLQILAGREQKERDETGDF